MVTVKLLGHVLPSNVQITASAPELAWVWQEETVTFKFRVKVTNSAIEVECDLDRYEQRFVSEIYKRATDLARATVNMAAFASGYGLVVVLDRLIEPSGNMLAVNRQEPRAAGAITAFNLDPVRAADFDQVFRLVLAEPSVFMALDDLIKAVTSNHTQLADCGRVVDRVRRIIAPTLDGGPAWREMQNALNISQSYQEFISRHSTGSRHGGPEYVPPAVCIDVLERTWAVLNRFLEYRKRGNVPLTAPEFPNL